MSCCQLNVQVFLLLTDRLDACKTFGLFNLLGYFTGVVSALGAESLLELSKFPPVPSTAGPAVLAVPALESSAEIPGPGLLFFLQGAPQSVSMGFSASRAHS